MPNILRLSKKQSQQIWLKIFEKTLAFGQAGLTDEISAFAGELESAAKVIRAPKKTANILDASLGKRVINLDSITPTPQTL